MTNDPRPEEMPAPRAEGLAGHLERVVSIGNRFGGSPGEAKCRELVLEEFSGAGLSNVRAEE